jgi:hypothetical protein
VGGLVFDLSSEAQAESEENNGGLLSNVCMIQMYYTFVLNDRMDPEFNLLHGK